MIHVVTGADGFIGSNLLMGLERHIDRNIDSLMAVDWKFERYVPMFRDLTCLSPPELVHHLAAGHLGRCVVFHQGATTDTTSDDIAMMTQNNLEYSQALFEACEYSGSRLVYASSAAVYGDGSRGFIDSSDDYEPLNPYAASKLAFDRHVRKLIRSRSPDVVGLRYFNVYGQNEQHKGHMMSVFTRFCDQALDGKIALFEGSDGYERDLVSVRDVVKTCVALATHDGPTGIFNLGSGKATNLGWLASTVAAKTDATVQAVQMPDALKGRYQKSTCADMRRLQALGHGYGFSDVVDTLDSRLSDVRSWNG